jgi:hypothetical protein
MSAQLYEQEFESLVAEVAQHRFVVPLNVRYGRQFTGKTNPIIVIARRAKRSNDPAGYRAAVKAKIVAEVGTNHTGNFIAEILSLFDGIVSEDAITLRVVKHKESKPQRRKEWKEAV